MWRPYTVLALSALLTTHSADAATREERGNLVLDNIPALDSALGDRLDDWLAVRGASFVDFLPDGALLISTRFGDVDQLHRVAAPGAAREQLTFYREPVVAARAARGGANGFVFLKDRDGNENNQLYFYSLADRSVRLLTDTPSLNGSPAWSRDGRRVAFFNNSRDPAVFDLVVRDVAGGNANTTLLPGDSATYYPLDWSPDDRRLLLWNPVSANESHLFLLDLAGNALTELDVAPVPAPAPGKPRRPAAKVPVRPPTVAITSARFAADGRGVFLISNRDSEFNQLRYLDLTSAEPSRSLSAYIGWDIEQFDVSADGHWLAYVANEGGYSRLQLLDLRNSLEIALPPLPRGQIANLRFDPASTQLAMTLSGPDRPRDVWTLDLEANSLRRWTSSETGLIDRKQYAAAQPFDYPSFDFIRKRQPRRIPAFIYRPARPGPHPVIIDIHGGPESQARPAFDPATQFLVGELGYAVVTPNVRGSTGYGRSYARLDDGYRREDAVRDIGALLDWIARQRDLDATRVVVMGSSYGGYMTLAALAAYGPRLRGGVDVVGISDFVTFLENTANYRQDLRRYEYGNERNPAMRQFLRTISPLTNAHRITQPLLIVQGMNDPRVPASESEQMVAAIRANGGEVWYLAAKDEGHGFRKKANRDFYLKTLAMFLRRLAGSPQSR
jgi:dipeptidyl aminopeptidase/acylaminoacyl peptidase